MLKFALLFILLAAAAPAAAFDVKAGVLRGDTEAAVSCPGLCRFYGGWEKDRFVARDRRSTCRCRSGLLGKHDEANAGPVPAESRIAWACVSACANYGGWAQEWRKVESQAVCRCRQPLAADRKANP